VVVRLARGWFDPVRSDAVRALLAAAETDLIPPIRRLTGLVSYDAAMDPASGSMINVSVWESFAAAQGMESLPEMRALRDTFLAEGVRFEPTITYDSLWRIAEGWLA